MFDPFMRGAVLQTIQNCRIEEFALSSRLRVTKVEFLSIVHITRREASEDGEGEKRAGSGSVGAGELKRIGC